MTISDTEAHDVEIAMHRNPTGFSSTDPFVVGPCDLARPTANGPLGGLRFVAKDLFDVAGTRTGAGSPLLLESVPVASEHAVAVNALLGAGAHLVGKSVSDELALSLSGTNVHYGTPINPKAPDRVPGGSSSGSVSAVASGRVDFALGTDTGGSIRVPASYCGVLGLRTTHDRISKRGVTLLAPSFCTVGLFARDGDILRRSWNALRDGAGFPAFDEGARTPTSLLVVPELFALADNLAKTPLMQSVQHLSETQHLPIVEKSWYSYDELVTLRSAFRAIQLFEAWQLHGPWITATNGGDLGPGIAQRFKDASLVSEDEVAHARAMRRDFQIRFADLLSDGAYLVHPASSSVAPPIVLAEDLKNELRARTLLLTAIGGLAGAPVVSLPLAEVQHLPIGLAVVGRPGDDDALVHIAATRS